MDFFTNQWAPETRDLKPKFPYTSAARRASQPEYQYKATPAPRRRYFQPESQYQATPAPVRRDFQPEFQYQATQAPARRTCQWESQYRAPERRVFLPEFQYKAAPDRRPFQSEFQYKEAPAPERIALQRDLQSKAAAALKRRAQYKPAPAPERRSFQPEFQYKPAPGKRRLQSPIQYKAAAPERRPLQWGSEYESAAPGRTAFRPDFQHQAATPALRRSRKVVKIPVRSPGEDETRPASALKIQKVFRGYLVRKSVGKILAIKREVDAIEARVSKKDAYHLLRQNDGNERLKVSESLMALLLKLDAVAGYGDSGIRLCRKSVIRKAIALQEKLDSIANGDQALVNDEELKPICSDQIREYQVGAESEKAAGGGGGMVEMVVEQNEKMMKMMVELFEMNEAQEKMIISLNHRLELLEKAFICDKIDEIKRMNEKHSLEF